MTGNENVYSVSDVKSFLTNEINSMMKDCIAQNSIPYFKEKPFPQDMNIITGKHLADINKVQLDLKAGQIHADSLKWIYGKDACDAGLKLKLNEQPLVFFANLISEKNNLLDENISTDLQEVYLLDQFTPESISETLNFVQKEPVNENEKYRMALAKNMLKNITEYDSGINEKNFREIKRKNISENCSDKSILFKMNNAFNNATKNYTEEQKNIFNLISNYFILQETGINLGEPLGENEKKELYEALKNLSSDNSPKLAETLADCFLYSDRMTHYHFEQNRIYSASDLEKDLKTFAPAANSFEPKTEIEIEKNTGRNIERERNIKPRQITHQLGGR